MLAQSNSITITKRKLAPSKQGVGWVQNTYTLLLIAAVAALVISALTYLIKASSASVVIVPVANQEHAPVKSEAAGASEGSQPEAAMDAESGDGMAGVMSHGCMH